MSPQSQLRELRGPRGQGVQPATDTAEVKSGARAQNVGCEKGDCSRQRTGYRSPGKVPRPRSAAQEVKQEDGGFPDK